MARWSGQPQIESQSKSKVDKVVQEYMDSLLNDLLADVLPESDVDSELDSNISESTLALESDLATEPALDSELPSEISVAQTDVVDIDTIDANPVEAESTEAESVETEPDVADLAEAPLTETELNLDLPDPVAAVEAESIIKHETELAPLTQLDKPEANTDLTLAPLPQDIEIPEPLAPAPANTLTRTPVETGRTVAAEVEATVKKPIEIRYKQAPLWAQEPFEVLLFDVCGLKLGVPMEALGRIVKTDEEPHHLIGKPKWFMGAYEESEQRLYVVDTAKYIMPEKGFDMSEQGFSYVIQLQHSHWTLACQAVQTTINVDPDQVKWRGQTSKRPWLAGTIIDHMCALLHVDSLVKLLDSEIKP